MKKTLTLVALITFAFTSSYSQDIYVNERLEKQWEVTGLKTPESVLYDPSGKVIYVANINENPWEKDGNGYISRHKVNGDIIDNEWVKELSAPKGMGLLQNKLYVTNIDEVVEIDVTTAKITKRYKHPEAVNLNDIAVGADGRVFVSDSKGNYLFEILNGAMDILYQSEMPTNGLFYETGRLLCGQKNHLAALDLTTKTMSIFIEETGSIDGIEGVGDSTYVISDWSGRVHLIQQGQPKLLLLDTTPKEINAADIEFDPNNRILFVPTFFKNSVAAYKLK
jgi:DNA-binding beta-propeller fold protein YncE